MGSVGTRLEVRVYSPPLGAILSHVAATPAPSPADSWIIVWTLFCGGIRGHEDRVELLCAPGNRSRCFDFLAQKRAPLSRSKSLHMRLVQQRAHFCTRRVASVVAVLDYVHINGHSSGKR